MAKNNFIDWLLGLSGDRETSLLGKQRFVVFLFTDVALIVLNTLSIFTQPLEKPAIISAIFISVVSALLMILYFMRMLPLRGAITLLLVIAQAQNVVEMVTYSYHYSEPIQQFIITDILTSLLLVMTAFLAYLHFSPTIVSVLSIFSYAFVLFKVNSPLLEGLFPVYLFILVTIILYDSLVARTVFYIDEEKVELTDEFTAFIQASGLSRDDIKGYSALSRNYGTSTASTREILMTMKPRAQQNLMESVMAVLREENSDRNILHKIFPSFTETQLSIAQLIIQDKKLSEICMRLGKSENNISAQRSNIRAKLNLSPEDNLRDALVNAVEQWRKKQESIKVSRVI